MLRSMLAHTQVVNMLAHLLLAHLLLAHVSMLAHVRGKILAHTHTSSEPCFVSFRIVG